MIAGKGLLLISVKVEAGLKHWNRVGEVLVAASRRSPEAWRCLGDILAIFISKGWSRMIKNSADVSDPESGGIEANAENGLKKRCTAHTIGLSAVHTE